MSWNAARRLRRWGYHHVVWYGPGTDGWTEESLPLYQVQPAEESGFQ